MIRKNHDLVRVYRTYNNVLTPREQMVIKMRYGIEDGIAHTLADVGNHFGITRERARQLEARAIRKLTETQVIFEGRPDTDVTEE